MPSANRDGEGLLDRLIREIEAQLDRGEEVSLPDYESRYPQLAASLRDSFPSLLAEPARPAPGAESPLPDGLDRPNRQLGDYRIIREIGRGGMGVVYEAEQVSLGRRVALKVLPRHAIGNRQVAERFRREARAAAGLHHTNIVPVYEVGQEGDLWYYAMQFIPGQGLDLVIRELKQLRRRSEPGGHPRSKANSNRERTPSPPPPVRPHPATLAVMRGRPGGWKAQSGVLPEPNFESAADFSVGFGASGGQSPPPPQADNSELLAAWSITPESNPPGSIPSSMSEALPPAANSSVILPGGASVSGTNSNQLAYHRGVARVGHDVAAGLAYAHGRGVIHRDIKPANLLLDDTGFVWITDFGLAKAGDDNLTVSGDILGTVRYMAPERFRGEGDGRADTYALGLTLYEVLTLRPAFESFDQLHLIEQIRHDEPPRPRSIDPRIPRDLETIILKSIEKDPRNRYATAQDLAEDLRRFLDGEPVRARQVGEIERMWKWSRRHPAVASLTALVAVLLILGTTVSTILALRANRFAEQDKYNAKLADSNRIRAEKAAVEAQEQTAEAERSRNQAHEAAQQAERAKDQAREAELNAKRQAADSKIASALATAADGEIESAVFSLIDALALAPDVTEADKQRRLAIRRNIAAWSPELAVLRAEIPFNPEHMPPVNGLEVLPWIQFTGPAGRQLNQLSNHQIHRFDLVTNQVVAEASNRTFPGSPQLLSEDGTLIVTRLPRDQGRGIRGDQALVLEFATGKEVRRFDLGDDWLIHAALLSPDNQYIGLLCQPPNNSNALSWQFWRIRTGQRVGPQGEEAKQFGQDDPAAIHTRLVRGRDGRTVIITLDQQGTGENGFASRLLFFDIDGTPIESLELPPEPWSIPSGGGNMTREVGFDGESIVVVRDSGRVRWYNPADGWPIGEEWGLNRFRRAARLLPDARTMAVDCDDDRVRWYDLATRRECGPAALLGGDHRLIDRSGTILLARRGDRLVIQQVPLALRPLQVSSLGSNAIYGAAEFDRDRALVAAGSSRANSSSMGRQDLTDYIKTKAAPYGTKPLAVLDTRTGEPAGVPTYPLDCHPVFSPDGRFVAGCRTEAYEGRHIVPIVVGVWERSTGKTVLPWTQMPSLIHSLSFAPDGQTLAIGMVGGVALVDLEGPHPDLSGSAHPGPIARIAWSQDGQTLALGVRSGWDSKAPGAYLWDRRMTKLIGPPSQSQVMPHFAFLGNGSTLLVLDRNKRQVVRIDGKSGRRIGPAVDLQKFRLGESASGVTISGSSAFAFRPDGAVLAEATASVVHQYDLQTGQAIQLPLKHTASVYWAEYSPDGLTLATMATDGSLRLWDAPTGQLLGPPLEMGAPGMGLAYTPDGQTLLTFTVDGRTIKRPILSPAATEDPDRLRLLVRAMTGFRPSTGDELEVLTVAEWHDQRRNLSQVWPEVVPPTDSQAGFERWYRDRADDAHRLHNLQSQKRNLQLLATFRPHDWAIKATSADLAIRADQVAEGRATYAALEATAPREPLLMWIWQRGVEELAAGRAEVALWYLDRVVAARPDDWHPLSHRLEAYRRLHKRPEAAADLDRILALKPDLFYPVDLLVHAVYREDWPDVTRMAQIMLRSGPPEFSTEYLIQRIAGGQVVDPQAAATLWQAAQTDESRLDALNFLTLDPIEPQRRAEFAQQLGPIVARFDAIAAPTKMDTIRRHDAHQMAAALHYRAGDLAAAQAELRLAQDHGRTDPDDDYWLALIAARQGQPHLAHERLQAAQRQVAKERDPPSWFQMLIYHLREAEIERTIWENPQQAPATPVPPDESPKD